MKDEPPERRQSSEFGVGLTVTLATVVLWATLAERSVAGVAQSVVEPFAVPGGPAAVVLGLIAIILLNAAFVAAGTAVDLLRPLHVRHVREGNEKQSVRLQDLMNQQPRYSAACVVGSQIARLALVFTGMLLAHDLAVVMERRWGILADGISYGTILLAALFIALPVFVLNLIVGELVPKSYASLHPHGVGLRLYRFIRASTLIFSPFVWLVTGVAGLFTRFFGGRATFVIANQAEEEIKTLVESAEEAGEIEEEERELLDSVFEFTDTVAREVMTPRVDMEAVPLESDPAEVVRVIRETGHSRIPLYEGTDDQIVGIVHAKDLLLSMVTEPERVDLRELMRPVLFVPETKNLHDLMTEMRGAHSEMAVVQDEFGGTAGIVTTEDIVEELVGEIVDEHDVEEPEVVQTEDGYIVDGKTHLDDVNDELGAEFDSEEFDTVGGYVFGLFGRQPKEGESIQSEGYTFTVAQTDGRRVQRLRIERTDEAEPQAAEVR